MRRRTTQVFSLAFLDCICCGFGSMILIFVLSMAGEDRMSQASIDELLRMLDLLQKRAAEQAASREDMTQQNARVASLLADARMRNDSIHSLIDDLERKIAYEKSGQGALLVDVDDLQKEIAARQKKPLMVMPDVKPLPVGVPIGSNYIVIIIDTSGSMRDPMGGDRLYSIIIRKVEETLDVYPTVKGLQVLDANGRTLVSRGSDDSLWLEDSPAMRDRIKRMLRNTDSVSDSNPVPGIRTALGYLREDDPEMRLGLYVFGDEFNGRTDDVIRRIDALNPADEKGQRRAVINAVAFPTFLDQEALTNESTQVKFANLMRTICHQHGGAFIALNDL